jgi:hypothetical protein
MPRALFLIVFATGCNFDPIEVTQRLALMAFEPAWANTCVETGHAELPGRREVRIEDDWCGTRWQLEAQRCRSITELEGTFDVALQPVGLSAEGLDVFRGEVRHQTVTAAFPKGSDCARVVGVTVGQG